MDCATYHILYVHDKSYKIIGQTMYCEWQRYSSYLVQSQVRDCTKLDMKFTVYWHEPDTLCLLLVMLKNIVLATY